MKLSTGIHTFHEDRFQSRVSSVWNADFEVEGASVSSSAFDKCYRHNIPSWSNEPVRFV